MQSELIARRVDQVLHQRKHGHGTGATRIECNPSRDFLHGFEIHIADEYPGTDTSEANVNHAGARLHHVRRDQIGPAGVGADARDEDVGLAANGGEVARVAMAPRNRSVAQSPAENQRGRLAGDIAAPDNHGARTLDGYLVVVEQGEHAARSARDKASPLTAIKAPDAGRANGVEILCRRDRIEQAEAIDPIGDRQLEQYRIDARVGVEFLDHAEQGVGGRIRRRTPAPCGCRIQVRQPRAVYSLHIGVRRGRRRPGSPPAMACTRVALELSAWASNSGIRCALSARPSMTIVVIGYQSIIALYRAEQGAVDRNRAVVGRSRAVVSFGAKRSVRILPLMNAPKRTVCLTFTKDSAHG